MQRQRISTGTEWESTVGSSRAVRVADPYQQTRPTLATVETVLQEVGAIIVNVVRTRIFVIDIDQWEEIGRAHGEVFGDIPIWEEVLMGHLCLFQGHGSFSLEKILKYDGTDR